MSPQILGLLTLGLKSRFTLSMPKKSLAAGAAATTIFKGPKIPLGKTAIVKATIFGSGGTERAAYEIRAAVANKGGTVALVGTASVLALEDDAAWAVTLVANNTDDSIDVQATPDTANPTAFTGFLEVTFD